MRRAASLVSSIAGTLALLLSAGCAPSVKYYKLGRPDKAYKSVISLSPSTTEIITTFGKNNILKGRTAADSGPGVQNDVPIVASIKPDYEMIKKLQPDLIMYDNSLYNAEDIQKLKELGVDMFEIDAPDVAGFEKQIYMLGDKLSCATYASDYVGRIDDAKDHSNGDRPQPVPKVAIIMPEKGAAPMIDGAKSFAADVIRIAGGEPVGPAVDRFVSANPEVLLAANPDVIIVPSTKILADGDVKQILSDPQMASLNAVKNKQIKVIDQDVVVRRGARVDKFITNLHLILTSHTGGDAPPKVATGAAH